MPRGRFFWQLHPTLGAPVFPGTAARRLRPEPLAPYIPVFPLIPSPTFMAFVRCSLSPTVRLLPARVLLIIFGFEVEPQTPFFKRSNAVFYRTREKASRADQFSSFIMVIRCAAPIGNNKGQNPSSMSLDFDLFHFLIRPQSGL